MATDANGVTEMRYAYRMILLAYCTAVQSQGRFLLWLDAQNGTILKLDPLIHNIEGTATVFNRDPELEPQKPTFKLMLLLEGSRGD